MLAVTGRRLPFAFEEGSKVVRVTSMKNPNLVIVDPPVRFVDGVAEVSPETAKRLRAFAVHGVVVGDAPAAPEDTEQADTERAEPDTPGEAPEGAPKPYASRGEWAKYAESVGLEPGDMTKAQIQAAVAGQ